MSEIARIVTLKLVRLGRNCALDPARNEVNRRFDQTDAKFDSRFTWMIGFQFATLMAVIAALLNVYFR